MHEDARAARDEFLRRYAADLEGGRVGDLTAYQALFPGFEAEIAEEYHSLEDEGEPATEASPADTGVLRFGDYRLLSELGRGGQAVVYLAEEERLGRQVALKVLRAGTLGSSADLRRFQRESEVTARLDHPGICSVFAAGEHDGVPFLAMRHVRGETLAQRIAREREAAEDGTSSTTTSRAVLEERLRILERCARILHFAHDNGLVHRDVKPGNVMLAPDGEPVLLDFGLAHAEALEHSLTLEGSQLGTPYYMAPEQIRGELRRVDARTDVYALGVVAFEMLALRRPFEAPTRDALYRGILAGAARKLRDVAPSVPRDLDVVVTTAMAVEPARRYQSALDLAEDLRRVRVREPIRARPATPLQQIWSWARRRPAVAGLVAALVLVTGVGIVMLAGRNRLLAERFAEVTRLADLRRVDTLRTELRRLPAFRGEHVAALDAWLQSADALLARLPAHRATLERLRREPGVDRVAAEWQAGALEDLIRQLERFGELERVLGRERREHAASVERRSSVEHAAEWQAAIAAIAASERYSGLEIRPQTGLVPLGTDPDSGLHEFAHLASGEPAQRGPDGRLSLRAEDGIVFVLLPGGTFTMGAQRPDDGHVQGAPNVDPWCAPRESPPHAVALEPFFIAKYETTRGQWRRLTGEAPSQTGLRPSDVERHTPDVLPVNTISHRRCRELFDVFDLALPTEAQWEYAARAGTSTVWWFGNAPELVARAGNVVDGTFHEDHGKPEPDARGIEPWRDGFAGVAPVGSFRANGFGLCDVVGNVTEIVLCEPFGHLHPLRPGDGARLPAPGERERGSHCVIRGGDWASSVTDCRSAFRQATTVDTASIEIGVRAARRVER